MRQIPNQLCGTFGTGTADSRTIRIPSNRSPANRAFVRQDVRHCISRTFCLVHIQDLRNDFTGFTDGDRITDADVLLRNEILIMERCIGHSRAGKMHRCHDCLGGQHAGSAHLHHNILHNRRLDLRRIFIGSSPTGKLGGTAHLRPLSQIIDFNHSTVNVIRKVVAGFVQPVNFLFHLLHGFAQSVRNNLKFQFMEVIQGFGMG